MSYVTQGRHGLVLEETHALPLLYTPPSAFSPFLSPLQNIEARQMKAKLSLSPPLFPID